MKGFDPFSVPISTEGVTAETVFDITIEDIQETAEGQQEIAAVLDAVEASEPEVIKESQAFWFSLNFGESQKSGYVAYDLETVPDESRFPRPEPKVVEERPFNYVNALKTEASITQEIAAGITGEQAMELLEMEGKRGKPRQGIQKKLQAVLQGGGDEGLEKWKRLALDPLGCRIVACGICYHDGTTEVCVAQNDKEEFDLLTTLFEIIGKNTRVGYNIAAFDDPVIMTRAMLLRVPVQQQIHVSRWGGKNSIDMMQKLFPGGSSGSISHRLKNILPMFGVSPPAGDVDGSMVLDMVDGGQWEELAAYVASDAWSEMQLFKVMQNVLVMS